MPLHVVRHQYEHTNANSRRGRNERVETCKVNYTRTAHVGVCVDLNDT